MTDNLTDDCIEIHGELFPMPRARNGRILKNKLMRLVFCNDVHIGYDEAKLLFAKHKVRLDRATYNAERRPIHGRQRTRNARPPQPKPKPVVRDYFQAMIAPERAESIVTPPDSPTRANPHEHYVQLLQAAALVSQAVNTAKGMLRSQPGSLQVILQQVQTQLAS
jgi:hypothetical protein